MTARTESRVTIIIPTTATKERASQLRRAVASVLSDHRSEFTQVIICANGKQIDHSLIEQLQALPRLHVQLLTEPSLPKAIAHGRSVVQTEFFGFLDDDDELLAGGLAQRLELLENSPQLDLVVCNGLRRLGDDESPVLPDRIEVEADALVELFKQNWLASCGGLFRSSSIGQSYFDDYHDYAEWTWLAYCLAIDGRRIGYLPSHGYVVNDTPSSRSKSQAYRASYIRLYERMLAKGPPPHIRAQVHSRLGAALHDLAEELLQRGDFMQAWRLHWRSVVTPGGMRYFGFARYFLLRALSRN